MAPTVSLVVAFSYKKISWVKKCYGFQTEKYELFKHANCSILWEYLGIVLC